jgi:hypothetical protein
MNIPSSANRFGGQLSSNLRSLENWGRFTSLKILPFLSKGHGSYSNFHFCQHFQISRSPLATFGRFWPLLAALSGARRAFALLHPPIQGTKKLSRRIFTVVLGY